MNIDRVMLKALAEAATPGKWVTDGEYVNEHGNVLYAYVAHENGGRIAEAFANCLVKTDEQCRANAAYIAAASPVAVLALLAEIERTESRLHDVAVLCATVEQERDQLKAENEALRSLVLSALEEGKGRPGTGGNAPGHCHGVPGVWDRGNGDRSGTACGWCRIWNAAQAMAREANHG